MAYQISLSKGLCRRFFLKKFFLPCVRMDCLWQAKDGRIEDSITKKTIQTEKIN